MTPALRMSLLLALTATFACSDGLTDGLSDTDAGRGLDDTDADPDTDVDTDDPQANATPSFWRVDGHLVLVDGAVVAAESSVDIGFLDDQGRPWQGGDDDPLTCHFAVVDAVDGPAEALEGEPLLGWWELSLVADEAEDAAPCGWTVPAPNQAGSTSDIPLVVGIGDFDSRLLSPLEAAGYSASIDAYGLYVLHPGAEGDLVYVFGVAGTEDQLAGRDSTVDTPPLPNGTYSLQTLVLLPVPPSE